MKIRYKTWYWGKFIVVKTFPTGTDAADFELYDESIHGWHHSDEFKKDKG